MWLGTLISTEKSMDFSVEISGWAVSAEKYLYYNHIVEGAIALWVKYPIKCFSTGVPENPAWVPQDISRGAARGFYMYTKLGTTSNS